eukprot:snap_masked-scaffold_6-processed-gene-5.33-mRNA-1 protein AED:0.39 eAED:0.39 QI:0/-1/0/1/-1/1/1/0/178
MEQENKRIKLESKSEQSGTLVEKDDAIKDQEEGSNLDDNLDDEDIDGIGFEYIIHQDLENIAAQKLKAFQQQQLQEEAENDDINFSRTKADVSSNDEGYEAMRLYGVTIKNYPEFCNKIIKKHTPFEIDLSDNNEDRPWRRVGASIDDFFNYGFTEHTWRHYAAQQVALQMKKLNFRP